MVRTRAALHTRWRALLARRRATAAVRVQEQVRSWCERRRLREMVERGGAAVDRRIGAATAVQRWIDEADERWQQEQEALLSAAEKVAEEVARAEQMAQQWQEVQCWLAEHRWQAEAQVEMRAGQGGRQRSRRARRELVCSNQDHGQRCLSQC